jgi:hypothetical protein
MVLVKTRRTSHNPFDQMGRLLETAQSQIIPSQATVMPIAKNEQIRQGRIQTATGHVSTALKVSKPHRTASTLKASIIPSKERVPINTIR